MVEVHAGTIGITRCMGLVSASEIVAIFVNVAIEGSIQKTYVSEDAKRFRCFPNSLKFDTLIGPFSCIAKIVDKLCAAICTSPDNRTSYLLIPSIIEENRSSNLQSVVDQVCFEA